MTSTQRKLGILLIVQVVLILLVHSPFGGTSTSATPTMLFPELDDETVSRVRLSDADDGVTLTRTNGEWGLAEYGGFPANQSKVDELIGDLAALEVRRPVVRSGKYHAAFKVENDDHEGRVRVWSDGDEKPVADLIIGSSANYRALRVRRAGDSEVYEVSGLAAYDVRPDAGSWIRTKLVDVTADTVRGISIANAQGSFELVKDESGWTAGGTSAATLDTSKVDALVRSVTGLSIAGPLGPSGEHGPTPSDAAASVTLGWAQQVEGAEQSGSAVILIGAKRPDDDARRSITVEGSGFSGEIWDSSVSSLIEKTLDDLALQNAP